MYRVVVSESMSRFLPVASCPMGKVWLLSLVVALLLGLGGCGSKKVSGTSDPFVAVGGGAPAKEKRQIMITLPEDDGKPLSPAEKAALLSQGELDTGLSSDDMRDVVLHFKSLVHGDGRLTVERNIERCRFYMPYIRQIMLEEKIPQELAYLAFVESGYNPLARSRTGALGMWQFISSTGKAYGMDQNWWLDERRDPYEATKAAATYLAKLYAMFNDWHLAITAYNAGEGKISRGLAATGTKNFFELRRRSQGIPEVKDRLTDENQQYLPRFLAVCKIMRNLDALGFTRLDTAQTPQIARLDARPGTDLLALCQNSGMSWNEFSAHNPAYQRYINHPSQSTSVYVPKHAESRARAFLSKPQNGAGWREYKVARGDTMVKVSRKTGIPVAELRRVNQVSEPLRTGKSLRIPGYVGGMGTFVASVDDDEPVARVASSASKNNAGKDAVQAKAKGASEKAESRNAQAASAINAETQTASNAKASSAPAGIYTVVAGDTLYSIARSKGVKLEELVAVNGLKDKSLNLGQQIRLPGNSVSSPALAAAPLLASAPGSLKASSQTSAPQKAVALAQASPAKASAPVNASNKEVSYKVQEGDSLWAIARKFNISPTELLALNKMNRDARLRPGDTVRVAVN